MTPLDYLNYVSRTLSQFALPGRFTASLESDATHTVNATSTVDYHGEVHGRSYSVTYQNTPGLFALTILCGVTKNALPIVRIALSTMPAGLRVKAHDYWPAGTDDDSKRIDAVLSVVLSAGSPQDFRAVP